MYKKASFLYRNKNELEIAVYRLDSHSDTQCALKLTEAMGWYEGHYTPDGNIECRTPSGRDKLAEQEVLYRYPTFNSFLKWCFKQKLDFSGSLDLNGCDLKGIKLPSTVGGYLYLNGCDLKGIKLPSTVGGYLDLRNCDLKGIKLPSTVGGSLYLSGCDLKGIKLPSTVGGNLDLSGCENIDKDMVEKIKVGDKIYW